MDPEELRVRLRSELAGYKRPRRIVALAELPRNAMGKVAKGVLAVQLLGAPYAAEIAAARSGLARAREAASDLARLPSLRATEPAAIPSIAARWAVEAAGLKTSLAPIAAELDPLGRALHALWHRQRDALEDPRYDPIRKEADPLTARQGQLHDAVTRNRRIVGVLGPVVGQLEAGLAALATPDPSPAGPRVHAAMDRALRDTVRSVAEALGVAVDGDLPDIWTSSGRSGRGPKRR